MSCHRWMISSALMTAALLLAPAGTSGISSADDTPQAEQIMDGYVEATGGLAAYDRVKNRITQSTMEIRGAGVKLSTTLYSARPNKAYSVIESSMTGRIESGTDGETVWDLSAMAGAQVKEGIERSTYLHLNAFDRFANWRAAYRTVELQGAEEVEGRACHRILATPAAAPAQTLFIDKESHLIVKAALTIENQAGKIPMEIYFSDYRPADGILIARKSRIKLLAQERIVTVDSVEHNANLPADRFDLPKEIKALAKR